MGMKREGSFLLLFLFSCLGENQILCNFYIIVHFHISSSKFAILIQERFYGIDILVDFTTRF